MIVVLLYIIRCMKYCFLTDDGTCPVVASVYAQYLNFSYRLCSPISHISPLALDSTLVLHWFYTCSTPTPALFSTNNATNHFNTLLFYNTRTSVHHHDYHDYHDYHDPTSHHPAVRPLLFRRRRRVQHHPQLCRHFALDETDIV